MGRTDYKRDAELSTDLLGDTDRIREILAGWGMDRQAIARMLREHNMRLSGARREPVMSQQEVVSGARAYMAGQDPAPHGARAR